MKHASGSVYQKHNNFVVSMLADLRIAREFLQSHLPSDLHQKLDFSSLQVESECLVKSDLKALYVDVLYSIKQLKKADKVYVLLEHSSKSSTLISTRFLEYSTQIFQRHRSRYKSNVNPLVVPIDFYTGLKGGKRPACFWESFGDNADLMKSLWSGSLPLVDVNNIHDRDMISETRPLSGLLCALMRRDLQQNIDNLLTLTAKSWQVLLLHSAHLANLCAEYLLQVNSHETASSIAKKIAKINPQLEEHVMSVAEKLIFEGEQIGEKRGEKKGEKKGEAKLLLFLLEKKFGVISLEQRQKITVASPQQLRQWGIAIFAADSIEKLLN